VPRSKGGETSEDNLALSCQGCNGHKYTATTAVDPVTETEVPLFDPRQDLWQEHFAWSADFTRVVGLSEVGRATVDRLKLNRPGLVNLRRVLVEACPASTLKRMSLPHQNYKQPEGGPLRPKRRRTRRAILEGLAERVEISPTHRLVMMRNGGGDALDAVVAAVGAARAWDETDHRAVARHPRYPLEGRLYV